MPLTACKDCGREVSTRASHCVHCGRPWPGAKCQGWMVVGALAAIAIAVTGVCVVSSVVKHDRRMRADVIRAAEQRLELERAEQARQADVVRAAEQRLELERAERARRLDK